MTDSLLNILKYSLLGLLYLFFARVLWAVWSEVSGPRPGTAPMPASARATMPPSSPSSPASTSSPDATTGAPAPASQSGRGSSRPAKGKRGKVGRLVVLEPKVRKGAVIGLANEVTFGRAPGCTISVPDDTFISQVHSRIFRDADDVIVEDLTSTNGTYVNGNRITMSQILRRGDRIQIGSIVLEAD